MRKESHVGIIQTRTRDSCCRALRIEVWRAETKISNRGWPQVTFQPKTRVFPGCRAAIAATIHTNSSILSPAVTKEQFVVVLAGELYLANNIPFWTSRVWAPKEPSPWFHTCRCLGDTHISAHIWCNPLCLFSVKTDLN